jgi:hypothetical protein
MTNDPTLPVIKAFVVASAASTRSRIRSESEILPRLRRIVTGLTARTSAAARPAPAPATRRTARYRTSTVNAPSTTWGSAMAHRWKPKRRNESAWTHSAPGSLSTVTVPHGSNAPKRKLCQLCDMLRAAAP